MEGTWYQGPLKIDYNHNPKRKKCPKSPFYFFMMDQRANLAAQGYSVGTMAELTAAAYESWKDLGNNPAQMEKYMEMHREWKMKNKYDLENKYDTLGRSLADIEREAKKKRKEKEEEDLHISRTVERGKIRGDLVRKKFHIAYFNTLCETYEGFHIPCEAGIVEYSVEGGVSRGFHEFISPVSIPLGYKFLCTKKSRETHNIPPDVEDFELYVGDYRKIFAAIEVFLTGGSDSPTLPPLYVMPAQTEAAQYITKFITEEANADKRLSVYQLPKLLYELRNAAPDVDVDQIMRVKRGEGGEQLKWIPSVGMAELILEKEPYAYWRGLGCDFHEALDNTNFCALAKAKGLAYHLADICSAPFNVTMKPNRHAPVEAEIRDFDERMKDASGFFSSVTRAKEICAQANTMEWVNPWGTKISIHAAPGGVTTIPSQFDPSFVEVGHGAEQFPGLHPEIDTSSEGCEAGGYGGESLGSSYTGNVLFSLDEDEDVNDDEDVGSVKSATSTSSTVGSVKSATSTSSTVKYGESRLAGLFSQDPGTLILPSLADPNRGSLHPLTNRPGATQAGSNNASTHLDIGNRRGNTGRIQRGRSRGGRGRRDYMEERTPQEE